MSSINFNFFKCFALSVSLSFSYAFAEHENITNSINMVNKTDSDASLEYYVGLVKLALSKINKSDQYSIHFSKKVISQGRIIVELEKKNSLINLFQTGTSIEREKKLIPIRIPLLKGTLGYRIPIIHKDNVKLFDNIKSLKDLQSLVACQGEHWPDSDILEDAGLKVLRNMDYESMFTQTQRKYCDYFPRAIIEAYSEVTALDQENPNNQLIVYDKLLISYPFPMYFFVSRHNPTLAKDIEAGLEIAIADGSFDEYFKNNEITKHIYPLRKWKNATKIKIKNKQLPIETPICNTSLWLSLN